MAGGGLGYKVIKEKNTSWDLFVGVACEKDRNTITVTTLTPPPARTFDFKVSNNSTELLLGEESKHKLGESTSFKQKLTLFPNMTRSGEYRAQFDSGLVTAIANGINLQVTLSNRYNSEAPAGTKKSDTFSLTGINIALGSKESIDRANRHMKSGRPVQNSPPAFVCTILDLNNRQPAADQGHNISNCNRLCI